MLKRQFFYLFTVVTACDLLLKKSSSVKCIDWKKNKSSYSNMVGLLPNRWSYKSEWNTRLNAN